MAHNHRHVRELILRSFEDRRPLTKVDLGRWQQVEYRYSASFMAIGEQHSFSERFLHYIEDMFLMGLPTGRRVTRVRNLDMLFAIDPYKCVIDRTYTFDALLR